MCRSKISRLDPPKMFTQASDVPVNYSKATFSK
jgi:hypothetical protein